jgi:hypothetical protein
MRVKRKKQVLFVKRMAKKFMETPIISEIIKMEREALETQTSRLRDEISEKVAKYGVSEGVAIRFLAAKLLHEMTVGKRRIPQVSRALDKEDSDQYEPYTGNDA